MTTHNDHSWSELLGSALVQVVRSHEDKRGDEPTDVTDVTDGAPRSAEKIHVSVASSE